MKITIKTNVSFILGVAYILLFTIWALLDVGEQTPPSHKYGWDLPVAIFMVVSVPFLFGYLAGKEGNQ